MVAYGHHLQNDRWISEVVFPGLRGGYFVEAGACGGLHGSATYVLERDLEWTGICVEPVDAYYRTLVRDRRCRTDHRCLAANSGERVEFVSFPDDLARSGIRSLNKNLRKAGSRTLSAEVNVVETVSLLDLLDQHEAPTTIHYLCLDVEGAERAIIEAFDFRAYEFLAISIEGGACDDLLKRHGYHQVGNPFAPRPIDHYFVRK